MPDGGAARDAGRALGRFRLLQLLGRNEHSMAWLAVDTRLSQEVMLTMPRAQPADADAMAQWQQRAKSAARLSHPHLAHVVEVGVEGGWPFVAVDRALGQTLDEWLATHPLPSPIEAVGWLCHVLQGLAFAHEAGVSHMAIEGYSVLVSEQGTVRLMGLGVISDTPSPHVEVEARSPTDTRALQAQRSRAVHDVLAVGLLLHRLLTGEMPLSQKDLDAAMSLLPPLGSEVMRLSRGTPQPVSEALRAIANRAVSVQVRQRYLSARTLLRALEGWLDSETQGRGGPLTVLMDRLNAVGHLPGRPGARGLVQTLRWDAQRNDEIAEQILEDMALTLEMLRQVNSAQVQASQSGAVPVITVRRAVALMGMNGVRRCGTGLRNWPGPLSEAAASALQQAMERVRLASGVAQALAPAGYDPEMVHLVTLMQNLGRLLVQYHFADEAEQIRHLMRPAPPAQEGGPEQPGMAETAASFGVLGMDIESLGTAVAKHWGLGEDLLHMMHRLPAGRPVRQPDTDLDWLRVSASAANEVVDAVTLLPQARWGAALAAVAQRYARVLTTDARGLQDALKQARDALRQGRVLLRGGAVVGAVPDAAEPTSAMKSQTAGSLRERLRAKVARSQGDAPE